MFGLIEDWLFSQIGINFNLNKLEENNIFQDGCVLVNILQKYGLVYDSFSGNIHPTNNKELCKKNLKLLKPLFEMLKINYNEIIINDIANNKTGTIINLLYEIYLHLENKQHLYFITKHNFEKVTQEIVNNLDSVEVKENIQIPGNKFTINMCLEQPLINNSDVIKWYKNKYQKVQNNLDVKVNKLKGKPPNGDLLNIKPIGKTCLSKCKPINNSDVFENLPELNSFLKSSENENLLDYQEFVARYKSKQRAKSAKKCFENNIQHELLHRTWSKIEEKQNEIYNSVLSAVLLKQSQYEKQILFKLIQAEKQVPLQSEHKLLVKLNAITEHEQKINSYFEMKDKFEMLEKITENEQKRVLELHKKLYKEKKDIVKKENYIMCKDIVDSLLDLSVCAAEYKSKHGVVVYKSMWDNWMQLFFKSQPIRVQLQSLEDDISAGEDVDYDIALSFEKEQDEILSENDVDDYLFTCGRWFDRNICLEHADFNENNLAFIVYRLLTIKYPLPSSLPAAVLPPFKITGVLLNLHSTDSVEKLKLLLTKSGVHIFDTEMAIKQCITQFKIETSPPSEEKSKNKIKETKNGKAKNKKSLKQEGIKENKSSKVKESKRIQKKSSRNDERVEPNLNYSEEGKEINVAEKETQTSITDEIKEEKTKRTPLGLLGEEVSNRLNQGEKLDDYLLVSVITEYLKSLEEYDGWLLLNYPATLDQAYNLELALTGKKIPIKEYGLDENKTVQGEPFDEWREKRKSRLLNCPSSETDAQSFKSYFTIFVKIENGVKNHESTTGTNENKILTEDDQVRFSKESLESTNVKKEVLAFPNSLKEFYSNQAIYKEFYGETLDVNSLKLLARLILKEDGTKTKTSSDLFGEETLNKLTKNKKTDKKDKPLLRNKKQKPMGEVMKKGKDKEKLNNEIVETNLEINKPAELEIIDQVLETEKQSTENLNESPTQVGEQNVLKWKFVSLPLNNELGVILATIWENIESCYINNLKDILFENRVINLRLHPYCIYVRKEMEKIIEKPDLKQNLINIFQEHYNNISNELRTLPEMKNQLHCRVLELQENLWEIADERKNEVETKRQDIINENWLVSELCMLINNFLSLVQTEFERSTETLKLVNDYYMNMLEKTPLALTIRPENEIDGRIDVDMLLKTIQKMSGELQPTEKYDVKEVLENKNFIAHNLVHCSEEQNTIYILEKFFSDQIIDVKSSFSAIAHTCYAQNKSQADFLDSPNKQLGLIKGKSINKERTSIKSIKGKVKQKTSIKSHHSEKDEQDQISMKESLIGEWRSTINIETERFNFRLDLINQRAKENIIEFYCFLESVFCNLHKTVLSRYNAEISNINSVCDYLKTAIEEESPLQHPLILGKDTFFIGVKETEENTSGPMLKELTEDLHDCIFTTEQLSKLINIFKVTGPLGVIRKQPLCYMLQDLILLGTENNHPYLPKNWDSLSELQLRYVIDDMFGLEFGVDWRDFIIYNLDIPYPEVDDILKLRKQFLSCDLDETELILLEDYENITLWFENELPSNPKQGLRIVLIKNLLPELFKVDAKHINYTALLLYFCKDFEPENGFKKALSLSLGKNVITSKLELDVILQNEEEVNETVATILRDIIDGIVMTREVAQVYEILESFPDKYPQNIILSNDSLKNSLSSSFNSRSFESVNANSVAQPPPNSPHKHLLSSPQISFPRLPVYKKSWVTKIPVNSVLSVLNAALFYQDKKFALKNQYLNCLEDEADSDGMIEAYDLVELSCIKKLFSMTNKFKISKPCDILAQCLNDENDNPDGLKLEKRSSTVFLSC